MGLGPVYSGRQWPITPQDKAWFQTGKDAVPQRVKDHHANQQPATNTQRKALPGRYDIFGRPLPR